MHHFVLLFVVSSLFSGIVDQPHHEREVVGFVPNTEDEGNVDCDHLGSLGRQESQVDPGDGRGRRPLLAHLDKNLLVDVLHGEILIVLGELSQLGVRGENPADSVFLQKSRHVQLTLRGEDGQSEGDLLVPVLLLLLRGR